jgi:hypothetical protein
MYYGLCFQLSLFGHIVVGKILRTFKSKILSSSSSKASEALINSAYYFFLALFNIYFMYKLMSHSMFILPHYLM